MEKEASSAASIRQIFVNDRVSNEDKDFVTNKVHTTKYSILTFLPYFFMHELSRPANIFFVVVMIIQQFDPSDPNKLSTFIPLSIVLGFTACKEIFEDLRREHNDRSSNERPVRILQDGAIIEIPSKDLRVGDIVRMHKGETFPADLVLLSSSEPEGMAYLETSNVDGESNLKIRMSSPRTSHLIDLKSLTDFKATLNCEAPSDRIYKFEGNLDTADGCFSLDHTNVMLRGAGLRNTAWIYGVVIYTGHETKIMMNASETPQKQTKMDRKTDQQYYYISLGLGLLMVLGATGNWYYDTQIIPNHWYLNVDPKNTVLQEHPWTFITFIALMLRYLTVFNSLVPISLAVTLEFIRLIMALLVSQDIEMYDEDSKTSAVARSSSLMEELGQIQCILTDKTGTLTCNEMLLRHLIIDGQIHLDCVKSWPQGPAPEKTRLFLTILATCHTIMIDYSDPEKPCYQGSSPDELTMVTTAAQLGYRLAHRSSGTITLDITEDDAQVAIEVFAVIEFTSARKKMSIIARLPDGEYYIFCKGADSSILNILAQDEQESPVLEKSLKALETFACQGLRTLCFAYKKLPEDVATEWLEHWNEALNTVTDRQAKIDAVAATIEKDLSFIGATGVEDRLQTDVPETINTLMKANIKIWMLTGDRFETAISTAFLSNLLQPQTVQLHLLKKSPSAICKSVANFLDLMHPDNCEPGTMFALVLNGAVIETVLSEPFISSLEAKSFLQVVRKCRTLLCCRLSPLQKSQIVRFAREHLDWVTLAIGDGGNDVSMIQAANVGVGVSGKEGLQASRSADFAIAQFQFLVKLILVHGSWSFHRLSRVVLYSIYKNFALFFCQLWFSFYNGFSATSVYEPWMFINWNLVFTCWPPTIIGLTDQYVLASELTQNPQLYEFGQKNKFYDDKTFWSSAFNGILTSLFIFFTVIIIFPEGMILPNGQVSTALMLGSTIFAIVLNIVSLKVMLFTNYLTLFLGVLVVLSAAMWYFFIPIMHIFFPGSLPNASTFELFKVPAFWALLLLVPVLIAGRDFIWKFYRRQFRPHPYHIVQELKMAQKPKDRKGTLKAFFNLVFEGESQSPKKNRGFSFSQTYGQSRVLEAYGQSPRLTSSKTSLHDDGIRK